MYHPRFLLPGRFAIIALKGAIKHPSFVSSADIDERVCRGLRETGEFCRVIAASDLLTETPKRRPAGKSFSTGQSGRQVRGRGKVNWDELADETWSRFGMCSG